MDQDSPNIDFLYDFLYLDNARAQSWLAQLVAEGVPVSFKYLGTESRTGGIQASGGIPTVLHGGGSASQTTAESHERTYSSQWSAPLTLIDMLDENQFIHHDITQAPLGSLVHLKGTAHIIDIPFMQMIWDPMTKYIASQQKTTHANRSALAQEAKGLEGAGHLLKSLPGFAQAYLRTEEDLSIWMVLRKEHMIVDTSAMGLSHGTTVRGEWNLIASIDAYPDEGEKETTPFLGLPELATKFGPLIESIREVIGRSPISYAVTPLAIFRAIHPKPD